MARTIVLIHSPSVGPLTWLPVANALREHGNVVVVPDLRGVAAAAPPYWPSVCDAVLAAVPRNNRDLVLVPHSNAGLFVPVMVAALKGCVRGVVFVDASLPAREGDTPVVDREMLSFLRGIATRGLLPRWTEWFDEGDVASMFPDPYIRSAVVAEQPQLPLAYYEQQIPGPRDWASLPSAYLWFGSPYDEVAIEAESRGWPVKRLPGEHLHTIVDPAAVAEAILDLSTAQA